MLTADDRRFVRALIRRQAGLAIEADQEYLVECRLRAVAVRRGLPSTGALVARLRLAPEPPLLQDVVDALCTNETSFFRDGHPFTALREHVLPALAERRLSRRALSIWCAACSSGQEVWSTAITIREHVDVLRDWKIRIVATDVSQAMVERTRAGLYTDAELARGMPPRLIARYFRPRGDRHQVCDELRDLVEVSRANLLEAAPGPAQFDLVLLRNVLIYFDADGKRRVLDRVHAGLAADGYLVVGATENLLDPRYATRVLGRTFVYTRRAAAPSLARLQELP